MTTKPTIKITITATETISHGYTDLNGRRYPMTYRATNKEKPGHIEIAVQQPTGAEDGQYTNLGTAVMQSGRKLFNLIDTVDSELYIEITNDVLAIMDSIRAKDEQTMSGE